MHGVNVPTIGYLIWTSVIVTTIKDMISTGVKEAKMGYMDTPVGTVTLRGYMGGPCVTVASCAWSELVLLYLQIVTWSAHVIL